MSENVARQLIRWRFLLSFVLVAIVAGTPLVWYAYSGRKSGSKVH